MAGHSKWANIKHRKARQDAKRSRAWSRCAKAIMIAAKNGGSDPSMNLTLRYAIDDAKAENMPKDNIEYAVKKGAGELDGQSFEEVVYEGYGPGGVAVMVNVLTDNRNRTAAEFRTIFEKGGGNLGQSGCVAYMFDKQGQVVIVAEGPGQTEDGVMEFALEHGADDVAPIQRDPDTNPAPPKLGKGEEEDANSKLARLGGWQLTCPPTDYLPLRESLAQAGFTIAGGGVVMVPQNTVACTGRDAEKMLNLMETIEDHDDVQDAYANYNIPDEELAAIQG